MELSLWKSNAACHPQDDLVVGVETFGNLLGKKIEYGLTYNTIGAIKADVVHVRQIIEDVVPLGVFHVNAVRQSINKRSEHFTIA
jgi:hypothetical protein